MGPLAPEKPAGGACRCQVRALRCAAPEVRCVFVTGHSDLGHVRAAFAAGAVGYVAKDAAPEELPVRAAVSANGFAFLHAAALAGGYIATLPDMRALSEIHGGRLVRVLPEYTVGTGNVFLVHPAAKVLPAKARATIIRKETLPKLIEIMPEGMTIDVGYGTLLWLMTEGL